MIPASLINCIKNPTMQDLQYRISLNNAKLAISKVQKFEKWLFFYVPSFFKKGTLFKGGGDII